MRPPLFPNAPRFQSLSQSWLVRYILLFACGWITVLLIDYFYGTIALFSVAAIFAALLNYPVVWLSRYIPRGIAIALTFMIAIVVFIGLSVGIGLQLMSQGQGLLAQIGDALDQQPLLVQNLLDQLNIETVVNTLKTSLATSLGLVKSLLSSVFVGIFGAVISLYMLIDGEKLWRMFVKRIPETNRDRFAKTFQKSFLGFIRGQLLLMLFLSTTSLLILPFLGVDYSLILAVILGLIDAIPGVGATLGVILVTFLVFTAQGSAIALKVFVACIILIQIQDNIIRPKVMGDALELNPVLLFLALFIGERVAGLLGIFLSIPIAGMIALWMQSDSSSQINEIGSDN
ncbi:hypothetical protein LEP3755_14160 [Leptolyngbya sp. NIES-3755]|nr:hypothetical protein LEP3755_14160 [Leptolyngbya sp. NIES-3755]